MSVIKKYFKTKLNSIANCIAVLSPFGIEASNVEINLGKWLQKDDPISCVVSFHVHSLFLF